MEIQKIECVTEQEAAIVIKKLGAISAKCRQLKSAVVVLVTMHNVNKVQDIAAESGAYIDDATDSDKWQLLNGV